MAIACDSTSLVANASCYECQIPQGMQMAVLIYLMCQIANNGTGGGAGATFGNYGGAAPNFTPPSGTGVAIDTSTQNLWVYDNGGWHLIV
jgi:hypothetical protein